MRIGQTYISIMACIFLTSCAQPLGHGEIDWDRGARRAMVLEILTPQAAEAEARTCVSAGWDWHAGRAYARVRYRRVRHYRNAVATVPVDLALRPGDEIELWPGDCSQGRLGRVERVLFTPEPNR
jgi:hypothetical protein